MRPLSGSCHGVMAGIAGHLILGLGLVLEATDLPLRNFNSERQRPPLGICSFTVLRYRVALRDPQLIGTGVAVQCRTQRREPPEPKAMVLGRLARR